LLKKTIVVFLLSLTGCVPSPSENTNVPPKATDLHSFITPQDTNKIYLWRFISPIKDSAYFLEYLGKVDTSSADGFSPVSRFLFSDTLRKHSSVQEAYISDSIVIYYFGKSRDPLTPKQIMLRDTLKVGASWVAADNFLTSNGARISIRAIVEDYYSETPVAGNMQKDVYRVSYTSSVKGTQNPIEAQYQNGAHLNIYFARNIGAILELCKDSKDSLVWTNELLETRTR
jgi:hypothetical protein